MLKAIHATAKAIPKIARTVAIQNKALSSVLIILTGESVSNGGVPPEYSKMRIHLIHLRHIW